MIFETKRLIIRNFRDEDRAIFAAIAGKPEVRLYHARQVSRANSDAFIDRQIETINEIGCGYAVVERKTDGAVVGDVGMRPMKGEAIERLLTALCACAVDVDPEWLEYLNDDEEAASP